MAGTISAGPVEQFIPNTSTPMPSIVVYAASTGVPSSILPYCGKVTFATHREAGRLCDRDGQLHLQKVVAGLYQDGVNAASPSTWTRNAPSMSSSGMLPRLSSMLDGR